VLKFDDNDVDCEGDEIVVFGCNDAISNTKAKDKFSLTNHKKLFVNEKIWK
jgi:hypothetical protein